MTVDEYKDKWLWDKIDYDDWFGYQCVDLARHFADKVHWKKIGYFWGSAINWWNSWRPFAWFPYIRVRYVKWMYPPRWAIIFFDKTTANPYWHVAIAGESTSDVLFIMEQNGGKWSGSWEWVDAIRIARRKYVWDKIGNVLGWYVLYVVF